MFCRMSLAVVVAALLILSGLFGSAGAATILLTDDFDDNSLDATKWTVDLGSFNKGPTSVTEANQRIDLSGRGHLNTTNGYDPSTAPNDGIRIRGTWKFVNGDDVIQVLTRSDGTPAPTSVNCCGETQTGIEFKNWTGSNLGFGSRGAGVSVTGNVAGNIGGTPAIGETYAFDIRDDGTNLFATMRQIGGSKLISGIAASTSVTGSNLITFHNRESNRQSWLDDVVIDSPLANSVGLGPILIEDRFTDNTLDTSVWATDLTAKASSAVTEANQRITFVDRGYLNTVDQFDPVATGGVTIRGRWTFESGDDLLQILTRSDGTIDPSNCCGETANGIQFTGSANGNAVGIGSRGSASVSNQIGSNLVMSAGETYDFQIVDDGTNLSFTMTQVGGIKAGVATATSTSDMATDLITFHNRESHTSHLDNVVIAEGTPSVFPISGPGTTPAEFLVREVHPTTAITINTLALADDLLTGVIPGTETTGLFETINFNEGGGTGNFGADDSFLVGGNNFAVQVTGPFAVSEAGDYSFGVNIDDGARLMIDGELVILEDRLGGAANFLGHIELDPGIHMLDLVFFEATGGANLELFYFEQGQGVGGIQLLSASVPEPSSIVMLMLGVLGLGLVSHRRRVSRG